MMMLSYNDQRTFEIEAAFVPQDSTSFVSKINKIQ